jgi:hypothetical protein
LTFPPRNPADRHCARGLAAALLLALLVLSLPAAAGAAGASKKVTYRGYSVRVPRSWPVYNLAAHPATCVRFNRHAVYLGRPGANESCPGRAIGRTEAILVEPAGTSVPAGMNGADVTRRVSRTGVLALATWNRSPRLVQRALGFKSVRSMAAAAPRAPASSSTASLSTAQVRASSARSAAVTAATSTSTPGEIYTGKGFDVCSTPSESHMSSWGSSPYRAIGVYIGGTNRACSQTNLTSSWVTAESEASWHVIPIYVGLQAPNNSCGCKGITPSSATSQGTAAAKDAVTQALAIGIGPGNPLYFDMEGYNRTSTNTNAVLAFLKAWTNQLHADGFLSGIYSSGGSGIADLVAQWGTGYPEPDELWFADWNGSATTSDSYVPTGEWTGHRRLHQYSGGVNKTYGGVTMNIDQDYLDAATAAEGSSASAASGPPTSTSPPTISGNAYVTQILHEHHGGWFGSPSSYTYKWYRCNGSAASCTAIAGATGQTYKVQSADVGKMIEVAETAGNALGTGSAAISPLTAQVEPVPTSSYYLFTAYGNVYNALGAAFYGSAVNSGVSTISAMAPTRDGKGYWLADRGGRVFHYGDAGSSRGVKPSHPIIGMAGAPGGGLYLLSAYGNLYNLNGAPFYGSPHASRKHVSTITGMAVTVDGRGYWVVDSAGQIFSYGDATSLPAVRSSYAVRGIAAAPGGGAWVWTSHGNIYNVGGAPFYGSPYHEGYRNSSFTGLTTTRDRAGYWMVQSGGSVLPFGNAEPLPAIRPKHPIVGLAG